MIRDCYICDGEKTVVFGGEQSFSDVYPDGDIEAFDLVVSYRCSKCGSVYEVLTARDEDEDIDQSLYDDRLHFIDEDIKTLEEEGEFE